MNRSQANRARIAARATVKTRPVLAPSTDLRARTLTEAQPSGAGIRKSRRPGRDKGQGEWRTVSPYDRSGRNPQWDRTVSRG